MAGGIPIDRNGANENTVQQVVDYFRKVDKVCLMIAPEGRLRRMDYWRSGFYYIALGAGVPVVPGNMDYKRKLIEVTTPFLPTGDIEATSPPTSRSMKKSPHAFQKKRVPSVCVPAPKRWKSESKTAPCDKTGMIYRLNGCRSA
jgi:1-acyl-sn-glycerol-3-phosphate acyltransferase